VDKIASIFANDITRQIEEVIKVDQTDADIIAAEIDEYVVTDAIKKHFVQVLEKYQETPQKPHEGVAIWISGFFGSGKSSFPRCLALRSRTVTSWAPPAARRFAARAGDPKLDVVLKTINEKIPTHTVIFDVSTDRGIRSGNQMLTEIMYRLFSQASITPRTSTLPSSKSRLKRMTSSKCSKRPSRNCTERRGMIKKE